jgi:hypothetical protein
MAKGKTGSHIRKPPKGYSGTTQLKELAESLGVRKDLALRAAMREAGPRPKPSEPGFNAWYLDFQRLQHVHLNYYNNLAKSVGSKPSKQKLEEHKASKDLEQQREDMTVKDLLTITEKVEGRRCSVERLAEHEAILVPVIEPTPALERWGGEWQALQRKKRRGAKMVKQQEEATQSVSVEERRRKELDKIANQDYAAHMSAARFRDCGSVAKKTDLGRLLKQLAKEAPYFPEKGKDGKIIPVGGRPFGERLDPQVFQRMIQKRGERMASTRDAIFHAKKVNGAYANIARAQQEKKALHKCGEREDKLATRASIGMFFSEGTVDAVVDNWKTIERLCAKDAMPEGPGRHGRDNQRVEIKKFYEILKSGLGKAEGVFMSRDEQRAVQQAFTRKQQVDGRHASGPPSFGVNWRDFLRCCLFKEGDDDSTDWTIPL